MQIAASRTPTVPSCVRHDLDALPVMREGLKPDEAAADLGVSVDEGGNLHERTLALLRACQPITSREPISRTQFSGNPAKLQASISSMP